MIGRNTPLKINIEPQNHQVVKVQSSSIQLYLLGSMKRSSQKVYPLHFFSGETRSPFSVSATGGGLGTCGLHLQWPLAWRSGHRRPRRLPPVPNKSQPKSLGVAKQHGCCGSSIICCLIWVDRTYFLSQTLHVWNIYLHAP